MITFIFRLAYEKGLGPGHQSKRRRVFGSPGVIRKGMSTQRAGCSRNNEDGNLTSSIPIFFWIRSNGDEGEKSPLKRRINESGQ